MAKLALVTIVVPDYDEAIGYFTKVLGFQLVEDTTLSAEKRWVVVSAGEGASMLLAKASTPEQTGAIGNQLGGRVGFFLHVEDFDERHVRMMSLGVKFIEGPRSETYGKVVVFEDMYGNRWDMIQPKAIGHLADPS